MGNPYTEEEEILLLKAHDKNIPIQAICEILGRPISGVYQKLRTLIRIREAGELDMDSIRKDLGL